MNFWKASKTHMNENSDILSLNGGQWVFRKVNERDFLALSLTFQDDYSKMIASVSLT